jgi:hypothetical protein
MSRIAPCGFAAALATAGLAAPAAAAPVLQADRECYTPGQPMTLTGTGYTASGNVDMAFSLRGKHGSNLLFLKDPLVADSGGNIRTTLPAPDLASTDDTQEDVFVSGSDEPADPSTPPTDDQPAVAQLTLSTWDVFVPPWDQHRVDPRKRVRIRAYGWEPATTLWAHYMRGSRTLANVRIGALTGPCGDLTERIREFPFRPVPAGSYTILFSGARRFDPRNDAPIGYRHVRVPASKAVR